MPKYYQLRQGQKWIHCTVMNLWQEMRLASPQVNAEYSPLRKRRVHMQSLFAKLCVRLCCICLQILFFSLLTLNITSEIGTVLQDLVLIDEKNLNLNFRQKCYVCIRNKGIWGRYESS